jgi:ABC-2 type transport system permease protein
MSYGNWRSVARKDVRDAIRSRSVIALGALFVLLFLGVVALALQADDGEFADFVRFGAPVVALLLPVVALAVGYKAILNERRTGTIVLSLSLPHSRRDLLAGTFVGRALVLSVPIAAGLVPAGLLGIVLLGGIGEAGSYLGFTVVTVLYGLAFLGLAIAISTSTESSRRATLGAVSSYLVLVILWNTLVSLLVGILFRFQGPESQPDWAVLLQMCSPAESYRVLLDGFSSVDIAGSVAGLSDAPWFAEWWLALIILVLWMVIPVALGYRRFERAEL